MSLPGIFDYYRSAIENELKDTIEANPCLLNSILRYHLGWVDELGKPTLRTLGKMVRGTLCLVSCKAMGGRWPKVLPAAAALELIHSFSLIHDDIEDGSEQRHHQPSVWKRWGEAQAINAGDAVYALAHLALWRLQIKDVPLGKILKSLKVMDETCLKLCEGQYRDIDYENRLDISVDDYLKMIGSKTATLIAASTALGVLMALPADQESSVGIFYNFGRELGLAYQIRDDILGIWGSEAEMGKPSGDDILKRKKTLPVIYALGKAVEKDRQLLIEIYQKSIVERSDIPRVVEILDKLDAVAYTQVEAEKHYHQALGYLDDCKVTSADLTELKEIASFFVKRNY